MYLASIFVLAALTSGGAPSILVANPETVCPSRNVPLEGRKSPSIHSPSVSQTSR